MVVPDPLAFEAVARCGVSALAWEALRRVPAYREAYRALPLPPTAGIAADDVFTTRWGMHFP